MGSDGHERFRHMIDETLAGGIPVQEEQSLREHLQACAPCQEYLAASNRVIAGLGGFSFAVDPGLNAKVSASLSVTSAADQGHAARPPAIGVELHARAHAHSRWFILRSAIERLDRLCF